MYVNEICYIYQYKIILSSITHIHTSENIKIIIYIYLYCINVKDYVTVINLFLSVLFEFLTVAAVLSVPAECWVFYSSV